VTAPTARPQTGLDSIAGFGSRVLAFIVDAFLANLIAIAIGGGYHRGDKESFTVGVAFLLIELLFVTLAGQTPGMRVAGIGVVRADGQGRPQLRWVLLRTFLIAIIIPALFTDRAGRGMHDRASGTIMLRTR
jgi:uncharacterized RDD family membrane protein YckC